jgi:hypothetical protein
MKKIEPGQVASFIANIGVIGGILLLVYELRQNNDLMEAEARLNRTVIAIDTWRFIAENADLAELREKERQGKELSLADTRRIDATIMAILVALEWTFSERPEGSSERDQVIEVQRYNFANYPEFGRVWQERKAAFNPSFVQWMDENVVDRP